MKLLKDHRFLVIGGSSGIGLATATAAVKAGAAVMVASRSQQKLDAALQQIGEGATQARLIPMAARQVEAADAALRLAQANLRAGTTLALDVMQASDALDQARLRYADAVVRYNQSQVNLLAALGVVDAARLSGTATTSPSGQSDPR